MRRLDLGSYLLCTKISDCIDMVATSNSSDIDSDEQLEPAKYDSRYYCRLLLKVKVEVTAMSLQYITELCESLASY